MDFLENCGYFQHFYWLIWSMLQNVFFVSHPLVVCKKILLSFWSGYGLVVHGIENGGRAARDKRLQPGDHILAINDTNITQETFDR